MIGPGSVIWRYLGDARFGLLLGRAGLLQLMHPTIAAGVDEHSDFREDPWDRLIRSWNTVLRVVYAPDGDRLGAEVRAAHRGITGTAPDGRRYHAWEPEAYWWVLASGFDCALEFGQRFGPPLSHPDRERAYIETRELGLRFGLRDRDMAQTLPEFEDWYRGITEDRLEGSPVVRDLLGLIARPPAPPHLAYAAWLPLRPAASRTIWLLTLGTLPARVREILDVGWSRTDATQLAMLSSVVRAARAVPARWRYLPVTRDGGAR